MKRERPIQKTFYVNEQENKKIKSKMQKAGKSNFNNYAREMLINGVVNVIDFEKIKELRYEVNRIGVNINQVVKLANENRQVFKNDIEKIIKLQKELEAKIYEVIKKETKNF